ncbi:Xanthine dehydrogenase [Eumeta japonica]|uniref:Xanthine dehydrogenase n=1 Tax=Eumeta variegata TaxID=151549 RepID=A0A4C1WDB3_EUMVA|nr:Xanthine dehydrogenase [Eumeta japonica]
MQCMVSVTSCKDWAVTTVEGLGDRAKGYHPIQKTLAEYNGSQCGYCSPGWVMAMYSLLESRHYDLTEQEIEDSFGSNVCRCTGYRPILDAFKSFGKKHKSEPRDIEDLHLCDKSGRRCSTPCAKSKEDGWCFIKEVEEPRVLQINLKDGRKWFRVNRVRDIFDVLNGEGYDSYMLVSGNTGKGAYPIFAYPRVLIDISGVKELKVHFIDQNLVVGSGTTLTDLLALLDDVSRQHSEFAYLQNLYEHINLVAHIPVRNLGTIAGNLMVKYRNREFSSDLYLLLETVGAAVTILDRSGTTVHCTPEEFLGVDMSDKVITSVKLPPLSQNYLFYSYKLMARSQSAHAEVNCGLQFYMDRVHSTVQSARIVFGGLSPKFTHAHNAENFLIGKKLFDENVLQDTLKLLDKELIVEEIKAEPSIEYRRKVALGIYYKGILYLCPDNLIKPRYRSGGIDLKMSRPLSKGKQVYDTNPTLWPDNEPMPKVEALIQCAGEAPYSNDEPANKNEVFAAFVTTSVSKGEIERIDPSAALKIPGVLKFFTVKDIPGINSFQSLKISFNFAPEEVLCDGVVKHYDQPLGIIVAETETLANRASKLVEVAYKNTNQKAVYTIKDAKTEPGRVTLLFEFPAFGRGLNVRKVIKGTNNIFGQYHFTMEPQTCVSIPSEDGIKVYVATQWMDSCQMSIAEVLSIEENRINLFVKRMGGAYGCKISRSVQPATACCLVTYLMNRPCRFVMSIEAMMTILGKRLPSTNDFEVIFSS